MADTHTTETALDAFNAAVKAVENEREQTAELAAAAHPSAAITEGEQ